VVRVPFLLLLVIGLVVGTGRVFAQETAESEKNAPATEKLKANPDAQEFGMWPQFRGVGASGVGSGKPPIEWDVESGNNILWKRKVDGLGHSCPISIDGRVFLTTAVSESNDESVPTGFVGGSGESAVDSGSWRWQVSAYDLETGIEIWRRTVANGVPTIKRHLKATHANSTPATDGKHVVACFGSEGLYCLDINGQLLWKKDFGKLHSGPYDAPKLEWGFASSPIIHDGKVILQCDCLNTGFVAVLNIEDGSEILRINRDDVATWSTPTIITTETETQLVCNGYRQMAGYDLATGERLWTLHGGGDVPVPAPLIANGHIFLSSGHGRSSAYAISPAARGDITPSDDGSPASDSLLWWEPRGGSYIPTPIIVGDFLYTCSDRGVLTTRDVKTGELVYQQRVGGQHSASAVATADHLYFSSEDGTVYVVNSGLDFKVAASNSMQEPVFATPAIVGDQLLIRTTHHLFCIHTED
jgi:outer membrane protein assembly factor BamB